MSHRSRTTPSRRDDSTGPNTTVSRSAIPVRPRLDTTTSSETRRPGLPSSPRDNLSQAAASASISSRHQQAVSPRTSPMLQSTRSTTQPSSSMLPISTSQRSVRQASSDSRSAPEDVPLLLDRSRQDYRFPRSQPTQTGVSALDAESDTVFGVAMPTHVLSQRETNLPPRLIPELQALAGHVPKQTRPPPPSTISTISSPSTRFTESPAPWSASTATTTPLSWSSTSPAMTQTHGLMTPDRKSKTVPQPALPRSRLPKLPVAKSPATRKAEVVKEDVQIVTPARPRRKKSIYESPAPTPPPRTSSVKRGGRSKDDSIDETVSRTAPSRPSTAPSSSQREPDSVRHVRRDQPDASMAMSAHQNLQESIRAPVRPTRSGTLDLGESRPTTINMHRAGFSPQQRQLLDAGFEEVTRQGQFASGGAVSDTEQSVASEKSKRSPSRLGKFSRFRLFGSREATSEEGSSSGPKKLQRRGPAAGTGHEGYGKHTRRGRKQSAESSATHSESERSQSSNRRIPLLSHSRRPSTTSRRTSQSEVDEFAVPRLRPVVMRGGSQTSVVSDTHSIERPMFRSPELPQLPREPGSPSPDLRHRARERHMRSPLASDTEDLAASPASKSLPNLAVRRSQRFASAAQPSRLPAPIRVGDPALSSAISSYDTTVSSTIPSSALLSTSSTNPRHIDPSLLKDKKARRKWWNLFKTRPSASTTPDPIHRRNFASEVAVNVQAGPPPRTIPYYAMLESETDIAPAENVGQILAEANKPSPPSPASDLDEDDIANRESVRLPATPSMQQVEVVPQTASPLVSQQQQQSRQPRLAQIGRIPKVVTRTERQHRPSRQSFSQPFSKSVFEQTSQGEVAELANDDEPPLLQIHTDVLPSRPFYETDNMSAKPASAPARQYLPHVFAVEPPMMDLAPVSSLDRSTSSSSAGMISIMGPPIIPTSYELEMRSSLPAIKRLSGGDDEDVWNEFDDIIDAMSPSRSPGDFSPEMTRKRPIRHVVTTSRGSPLMDYAAMRPTSRGKMPLPEPRQGVLDLPMLGVDTPPVILPSPSLTSERSAGEDIRLRRSRIISALHSSYNPASPFSMREFLKDYSEGAGLSERLSTSTAARSTLLAAAQFDEPRRSNHQDNAIMLDVVERTKDPIKQSELHYASLEVSRWLSFGRVLFSPAQDEIFTLPDRHVLVIDGLGNEDWSIYCAVTYEGAKAVVHDLKETSHYKKPPSPQELEHLPTNLRRAEVASFSERFPFHSAFFSVIVLRFPPAMTEAKMNNILKECRRILVPGGHIEVMLLEFDFVNMGVQTRRAVKELKMRMATKNPDVNLRPTIDHFQSVLGSRGFTGLSRFIANVSVVGRAPGSTDSSTSSRSNSSMAQATAEPTKTKPQSRHNRNFSLSDLVTDPSESADAQIERIVSRTARNWWQHCYEASVLSNGDASKSIFAEKRVLQECKMRGSTFKLLIAHAQRPVFEGQPAKRRTMSESNAPGGMVGTSGPQRRTRGPS